ncbi:MAG: DUF4416 family protein [Desulfobacteraceae bacterium]|nr:MAG: DUF4416 family protein [Desulfobacteraceae bacterium]
MSQPHPPQPAKLVIGVFTNDKHLLVPVMEALVKQFGDIDLLSPWIAFDYTRYYEREMGPDLVRRMMTFKPLIDQDALSSIKVATNAIEAECTINTRRNVNIDPGYMLRERFVLATGKNFTHRVYIGNHIYADLTLLYQKGAFQSLPWTYPDYKAPQVQSFLYQVRNKYIKDIIELES